MSASALKQIGALEAEKSRRTPVQQKIDSQLLYADKMRRGDPIAEGVPTQRVNLDEIIKGAYWWTSRQMLHNRCFNELRIWVATY